MTQTRKWAPYAAVAALAALLVVAYLARGDVQTRMWITPDHPAAGQTVTVRYAQPWYAFDLSFRRAGHTFLISRGEWREVRDGDTRWDLSLLDGDGTRSEDVDLPRDIEPGRYEVCSSGQSEPMSDPVLDYDFTVDDQRVQERCADLVVRSP